MRLQGQGCCLIFSPEVWLDPQGYFIMVFNILKELEEDIASHQSMFHSLNETGNQIMVDLEAGEVRTALQSKLDDMNDRWNSLGVRVVDIRDRWVRICFSFFLFFFQWRLLFIDLVRINMQESSPIVLTRNFLKNMFTP